MHLMIDLETGGTSPGCAIFSIGACAFSPQSADTPTVCFYEEISHESCMEIGLRFDRSTMNWWKQQGTPPNGDKHIKQVLEEFKLWISNVPVLTNEHVTGCWANSPSFDIVLLKHVFELYKFIWPIEYWREFDVRTLKSIAFPNGDYKLNNSHNALEDAKNQAAFVQNAFRTLGLSNNETRHNAQLPGNQRHF